MQPGQQPWLHYLLDAVLSNIGDASLCLSSAKDISEDKAMSSVTRNASRRLLLYQAFLLSSCQVANQYELLSFFGAEDISEDDAIGNGAGNVPGGAIDVPTAQINMGHMADEKLPMPPQQV